MSTSNDFEEILPKDPETKERRPNHVEAYVMAVEPRQCGPLVKYLSSHLPFSSKSVDLSHLKRVRKRQIQFSTSNDSSHMNALASESGRTKKDCSMQSKRQKVSPDIHPFSLEVLLGAAIDMGPVIYDECDNICCLPPALIELNLSPFASGNPVDFIYTVLVPAHPAESYEEFQQLDAIWPMSFYPKQTKEYQSQERLLSKPEIEQMKQGMHEALCDALDYQCSYFSIQKKIVKDNAQPLLSGTIVMSPETGNVIARANIEREMQSCKNSSGQHPLFHNPLSTSIILAIQGVSRLEREKAMSAGGMETEDFQHGQYLCTGYDVFTTVEPTVFEAMALVHSRIRRLVFGCRRQDVSCAGTLPGGLSEMNVHALPGTNHRYRAFVCNRKSDLWTRCHSLCYERDGK